MIHRPAVAGVIRIRYAGLAFHEQEADGFFSANEIALQNLRILFDHFLKSRLALIIRTIDSINALSSVKYENGIFVTTHDYTPLFSLWCAQSSLLNCIYNILT